MDYKIFENKEYFNFKGRTAFVNERLCLDFTASGFEFKARFNNSDLKLETEIFSEYGLIGVVIDNDYNNMYHIPTVKGIQNITVAENLNGEHIIKIVKLIEYNRGRYEISSVIFDGEFLEKPQEKALKFEFYGDSLTCGYGNLCTTRNSPDPFEFLENGYKTWCVLLCEKLGAEMSAISSSGQGVATDCGGRLDGVIDKYWDMAVPSLNVKWDFSYQPQYVFINLGTNDITYLRSVEGARFDEALFEKNAKKMLNGIREKIPNCKIIIALGHDNTCEDFKLLTKCYKNVIKDYKDITLYADISSNQLGGDWHPNLNDHKMMFEKLYNHLINDFKF